MTKTVRVLLADDHPTLRLGLRVLLDREPDIAVVAEAENGEEALEKILALQPDVAVLDCQLPGLSGPAVAREIQRRGLPVRVLALSAYDEDRYLWGMWMAGALGYLLKNEAHGAIVAAVRAAARGMPVWTERQAARIQRWREEVQERWERLTQREKEVLALVTEGKSNKEIAQILNVTERTVEFHISNILGKLGLASRVEAVVWVKAHRVLGE